MTETQIQKRLLRKAQKQNMWCAIDNCYLYPWESDFVVFLKSGFTVEYEIKLNKYDYKADFSKSHRHKCLSAGKQCPTPNRFYYVVPEGVIDEVPSYSGLIWIPKYGHPIIKKVAPLIHANKIDYFKEIAIKLHYKYWKLK